MRKSILVTAAIAVIAVGLALALSQTEQGKALFSKISPSDQSTEEVIASTVTAAPEATETANATPVPATTETVTETPTETTTPETTSTEAASAAPAMTPVDLDAAQARLNAEAPAAGEESTAAPEAAKEESVSTAPAAPASTYKVDVAAALKDRSIGSADAPVTVYDYSSLTCPHCAHFHNEILPKVKQYYIDTGKVRWVFKGFPLNEPALRGEMVARCAPEDQYVKLVDLMYQNQARWATGEDSMANLSMFLRLAGVTSDMFTACATNLELQKALLEKVQKEGEKFKVEATPTFVFNDGAKVVSGAGSYEGFANDLDVMLNDLKEKKAEIKSTPTPTEK